MTAADRDGNDSALIDLACALVRLPSVLGDENKVAEHVSREMRRLHYDHVEIDEAGNVIGIIRGLHDGPTVLLDAHMDTVDVLPADAWTHDPFGGELVGNRIYGRGSSDMKGALAAMMFAAAGLERAGIAGNVIVSASVGEESIEGAALRCVLDRHPADFVVIGEASGLDLVRAGRGRAEFTLETAGQPAHAASPAEGVNAVHKMAAVIREVEMIPMPEDPFVGGGVLCLTDIISRPYPAHSVVPSGCKATYERRLLPGESQESVEATLLQACARADAPDTTIELAMTDFRTYTGVRWQEPKWFPPWRLSEGHELVQQGLHGLRAAGLDPSMRSYQFCTNAAHSAGVAGVPTIGFGPSTEAHAHVVDEFLEVDQLLAARRGYAGILATLLATSAS